MTSGWRGISTHTGKLIVVHAGPPSDTLLASSVKACCCLAFALLFQCNSRACNDNRMAPWAVYVEYHVKKLLLCQLPFTHELLTSCRTTT